MGALLHRATAKGATKELSKWPKQPDIGLAKSKTKSDSAMISLLAHRKLYALDLNHEEVCRPSYIAYIDWLTKGSSRF